MIDKSSHESGLADRRTAHLTPIPSRAARDYEAIVRRSQRRRRLSEFFCAITCVGLICALCFASVLVAFGASLI